MFDTADRIASLSDRHEFCVRHADSCSIPAEQAPPRRLRDVGCSVTFAAPARQCDIRLLWSNAQRQRGEMSLF
jgi:hypothetical protein